MDPITAGILSGVLANSLSPILGQIVHLGARRTKVGEAIPTVASALVGLNAPVTKLIREAIIKSTTNDPVWMEYRRRLQDLIHTPELRELIAQIYADRLVTQSANSHGTKLLGELEHLLILHNVCSSDHLRSTAESVLRTLLEGCEEALGAAIDHGVLSAHDAREARRHQVLLDRIENIDKSIAAVRSLDAGSLEKILHFEQRYQDQVAARLRLIVPPQYDSNKPVLFSSVYVEQQFDISSRVKDTAISNVSELLDLYCRIVIVGQPGGGKSTFLQRICV
jgi:hypothetical protein